MRRVAVTGGGGFVGKAIVRQLLSRDIECIVLGRHRYPEVEELGATCVVGDIRDAAWVRQMLAGVDTVFHVAALAGIWGKWNDYFSINVQGTHNVIAGCRAQQVERLVYTSTPSVVFGGNDIEGGDERLPYPQKFLCHYAKSKVMAEREVLGANCDGLHTCGLRPHLVWGPGDPHLIPRLLAKGRNRELKQVGMGRNLVDISYVDNVAHAHLLAADNLAGPATAAGKSYFVSQCQPVNLWQWINALFARVGIEPVHATVPFGVAYGVGALLEAGYTLVGRKSEPPMTRFLAEQLAKSHYFSCEAIRQDLGYSPMVSTEEGMNRLVEWIRENDAAPK